MFSLATTGAAESPAVLHLQDGLGAAIATFKSDLDREPTPVELRSGFLFSIGALDYSKERFEERQIERNALTAP
jgi:hypothetical protein